MEHIGLTSVSLRAVNLLLVGVPTVLWCREFPDLQFDSVLLNKLIGGIFSFNVAKQLPVEGPRR